MQTKTQKRQGAIGRYKVSLKMHETSFALVVRQDGESKADFKLRREGDPRLTRINNLKRLIETTEKKLGYGEA